MCEILLRAYDKGRKEYLSDGHLFIAINKSRNPNRSEIYLDEISNADKYKERFVIERYTGLTDKNDKKIFEGDILKGSLPDMSCESERTGVVQWGMFGWIIKFAVPEWKIPRVGFGSFGEYEIIGNIHDNPELLKGGAE